MLLIKRKKELKAITKRNLSAAVAEDQRFPDVLLQDPSPTVLDREKQKTEKYSRLILMASKQFVDGKRSSRPAFAPFVVSDLGELGPNAIELQEWIVSSADASLSRQAGEMMDAQPQNLYGSSGTNSKLAFSWRWLPGLER